MLIQYLKKRLNSSSLATVDQANTIIEEYSVQGFDLTLRQLYYQFVARGLIPNTMREYKKLGGIINDARLAGLISWEAIVDRTRNLQSLSHWDSPADIIRSCLFSYRHDKWKDQEYRIEVWIEKDALTGIIEKPCNLYEVPYFSCRGYTSQSEMWSAGMRLKGYIDNGQTPIIIHLGDHDPSGIDMTRDIDARLELFADNQIKVERIALNMPQVEKYNPPPNPAKITDTRASGYIKKFGRQSWELDALDPNVIDKLIRKTIESYLDQDAWDSSKRQEDKAKTKLRKAAKAME